MSDTIHMRIKALRESLGMSMEDLAAAVGLRSWQSVQQWENGKTAPNRSRLGRVAKVLKTTNEYLVSGVSASWAGRLAVASVAEQRTYSYLHPNADIQRVVELLESMTDKGVGYVLHAAEHAAQQYKKQSRGS